MSETASRYSPGSTMISPPGEACFSAAAIDSPGRTTSRPAFEVDGATAFCPEGPGPWSLSTARTSSMVTRTSSAIRT